MNDNVAVIIFLRCPKPGHVKSRLARSIGEELACQVYDQCAVRILRSILVPEGNTHCFIFYSVSDEEREVKEWLDRHGCLRSVAGCQAQLPSDILGDRLVDAFRSVAKLGYSTIAVVGTDIPDLTAGILQRGIVSLRQHRDGVGPRALLGPSVDGGFYMMLLAGDDHTTVVDGLNLDRIVWSTGTVYEETTKALVAGGYHVLSKKEADVPVLRDIDVYEDLLQWYQGRDCAQEHKHTGDFSLEHVVDGIVSKFQGC